MCHDVGLSCWERRDPRDGAAMDLDLQPGKSAESLQRASAGELKGFFGAKQ